MVVDVVCLSSDTDDENGAAQLPKGFAGAFAVDSDDEQPLEALKLQLKAKSGSLGGSQPTGSQGGCAAGQGAASPKAAAAAGQSLPRCVSRGKENDFGRVLEDTAAADDCDLDNWTLEPLAKRVRRVTGRRGAAEAAPAAAASDECGAAGSSPAAAPGSSSGMLRQPQEKQQQQQWHIQEPVSQQHGQDSLRHQPPASAVTGGSPSGLHAAAAAPSRKRPYCAASSNNPSSPGADSADDWSLEEAAADAAAAAADADADADMSDDEAEGSRGRSSSRGRGRGGGGARAAAGSGKVRMSTEERAAQRAEQKARKEAEKLAAKLRRQEEQQARKDEAAAGKAAAKAAKKFETFASRKQNGNFCEFESVLVMDAATSRSALGMALSTELDRRKTTCWQVVPQLPLSGRWPGCSCFGFKRRKMREADEHASKTASTTQLQSFIEDTASPYVQLVFETPAAFFSELTRDSLAGVMAAVAAAHPDTTLGVVVLGLKSHVQRMDNQSMRQGTATQWDWRRVQQQLLSVHLSSPGLQLRLLSKLEEVAAHLINTARVLGQQPYSSENQLEACGGAGPSQASKSAAAAMASDLGPNTCSFAVNTLGKMHGMGGNKAWAVAKAYPSFGALIAGFQRAAAAPGGKAALLLQDLAEPAGAGKAKPRRVGPAMSKRLHLLLTCEDPDTIVEGGDGDAD